MARILLLGANGQVGWELCRSLLPLGEVTALTGDRCDFTKKDDLADIVRKVHPDIIVNAAAYTAVDEAEENVGIARKVNAEGPAVLAEEARKLGALLVDYSTDYVFNGAKAAPYVETDETDPVNVYGSTKLEGQNAIEGSGCRYVIFRVSWVYAARGGNFLRTMLRLAEQRDRLRVVADQVGSPTPADLIADVTAQVLSMARLGKGDEGVFHLTPAGETSWYGFASEIFDHVSRICDIKVPKLEAIDTSEYPTRARRPLNSRLDTSKLQHAFGLKMPEWQIPMRRIVEGMLLK